MQPEALKVFCDIVNLRSFSRAAAANELSQPTVTRLVQQLEERLGAALVDRSRRPLQLTPLGQAYYAGCKRLLDEYAELEASLRRESAELALSVRVAAIYSVGLWDMGQYTERFAVEYPHARVRMEYLHPRRVYEHVLEGTADLGLVSYPARTRELAVLPWREEEMVVACAPGHQLAAQESVDPASLGGEPFVAFDRGLTIRREVDHFLRQHRAAVEIALEFDNIENIKKAIEIGAGLAILPEPTLRREVEAGSLRAVQLAGCQLVRPLGIIHRRHHSLSSAAQGFIDLLRAHVTPPTSPDPSANGTSHAGDRNGHARARRRRPIEPR
jgi:DNA-binding transcriptional LysR family regulator